MLIRNKLIRRTAAIEYKKTSQYKAASTIAITEKSQTYRYIPVAF